MNSETCNPWLNALDRFKRTWSRFELSGAADAVGSEQWLRVLQELLALAGPPADMTVFVTDHLLDNPDPASFVSRQPLTESFMALYIRGRGFPLPEARITPSADGVRIRIDDAVQPASWIEIGIPTHILEEWLRQARLIAGGAELHELGGNPDQTNRHPPRGNGQKGS